MGKNILVTGGAGFMGSWLVDELLMSGHNVTSIDDLSGGYMRNVNKECSFVRGDLRDTALVNKVMKGIDIVYHLAAYAAEGQSVFSPIAINDINIKPMNNLLVAAVNNGVGRFVFTSSMAVYGNQKAPFSEDMPRLPEDPYGAGKAYCENMLEIFQAAHGLDYTIIRPHNVYGPKQNIADPFRNVLGIWINRLMSNRHPIIYGGGEQVRAFSYVEESTKAIANAGFFEKAVNQIINVGSPEKVTINEACTKVLRIMASEQRPEHVPQGPRKWHLRTARRRNPKGCWTTETPTRWKKAFLKWSCGQEKSEHRSPHTSCLLKSPDPRPKSGSGRRCDGPVHITF